MKLIHYLFSDWDEEQVTLLKARGIDASLGFHHIEIEDGKAYEELKHHFDEWEVASTCIAKFSEDDLENAKCTTSF